MSPRVAELVAATSLLACAAIASMPRNLDQLIAAERQFSATSVTKGMRDAFVEFLADGAVLFRPLPVDGKKLWASRDSVPGTLVWEPSFAQVASSGDFGYTTGPWEFRPPEGATGGTAYGHFISVWRKPPEGPWRVVADIGIQHPKPEHGLGSGEPRHGDALPEIKGRVENVDVDALDGRLSARTFEKGIAAAYAELGAADLILNRDGFVPTLGTEPARSALDSLAGGVRFESRGRDVAVSGDLGYTYGVSRWFAKGSDAPADSGVYLHVWRREGGKKWKLALAVENPQ